MRIVVIGAGEVGSYVAQRLSREGLDVVIVERDEKKLVDIERSFDVQSLRGDGTDPNVLRAAGVPECDLLVAVTSTDSVNLLACLIGKQQGAHRAIARIEADALRGPDAQRIHRACGADVVIDPDDAVAHEIYSLLTHPGANEVHELADGDVILIMTELREGAPLIGKSLRDIGAAEEPDWSFLVVSITRDGETQIPRSDQALQEGDLVRVVVKRDQEERVGAMLGLGNERYRRVMLLGGGRTAAKLATLLSADAVDVTLIEQNKERAEFLARNLHDVLVIQGDITDAHLLAEEDVAHQDAVVALTGDDDANILACLYAKSAGVQETISVLHRLELMALLHEIGIDVALSPRTASANAVLRVVRGGVAQVATSLEDDIEVFDVVTAMGCRCAETEIKDLALPKDTLVAAIARDGDVEIGRGHSVLHAGDHAVVVARPERANEVRSFFARQ